MSSVLERMYLDDSLIKLSLEAEDKNSVLEEIALLLKDGGYVKESFSNAIKEREVNYPTGLQLEHIGVAIPHTDAEFVNEQSMAIAILKNPVNFTFMGSEDVQVPAAANLPIVEKALTLHGNKAVTVKEFPGLNHCLQHCQTCLPDEYGEIRETVSPEVLQFVGEWIMKR